MGTTISGDTGVVFPDATTQSTAVTVATPFSINASAGAGAQLRLPEATANGVNYVAVKAADALSGNVTWTLPTADGTAGQYLQTNGSGVLSFGSVSPGGTTGQVQINNSGAFGAISSGTSGQVLTSNGAGVAPSFATPSGGLSVIDSYYLTSTVSVFGGPALITTWTRNTPTMTPLGGGITNTSGVFSFPSTGYWEVAATIEASTNNPSLDYITFQYSTDSGSTYSGLISIRPIILSGNAGGTLTYSTTIVVYISNASTFRFQISAIIGQIIATHNSAPATFLTFKKLA